MAATIIRQLLEDVAAIVMAVDAETYRARPFKQVSGSIGEHVRHCLDHIAALVASRSTPTLSYDTRERGTAVESDPAEALRRIVHIESALDQWTAHRLDEPIYVTAMISDSGETVSGWSTLAREIAFVSSHTIHHRALIGILLAYHGIAVAERFGYAPSTPRAA